MAIYWVWGGISAYYYLCEQILQGLELKDFHTLFLKQPKFQDALKHIARKESNTHLKGLMGSEKSVLASLLAEKEKQVVLYVMNDREQAAYFYDDMKNLLPNEEHLLLFPSSYRRAIRADQQEQEQIILRTDVLNKLREGKPLKLVTYPDALAETVVNADALQRNSYRVKVGDTLSIEFMNDVLFDYGFEQVDFVYEPGQYSIRGSLIDVFSFSNDDPYRLDFFGDEVDSIRVFDIESQISKGKLQEVMIIPNVHSSLKEEVHENFLTTLPTNSLIWANDFNLVAELIDNFLTLAINDESDVQVISGESFKQAVQSLRKVSVGNRADFEVSSTFEFNAGVQPTFNKNFQLLAQELQIKGANGYTNYILSNSEKQIERLKSIFFDQGMTVNFEHLNLVLHEGFVDHDLKICSYTDHQIFERYHRFQTRSKRAKRESFTLKELNKLSAGDFVVHIDHGIGKFMGLVKTEVNGKMQEAIRLSYRDNDMLLVSIHSLHRISKYKGKEGREPKINKLGTPAWQKLKDKTKSKVKDIARDLIQLYAKRKEEKGHAFSHDSYLQNELEASFIFEDTPDQLKATQAIKEDMEKPMPMDRLVCGDVGFGKTEVAIRAAFKAATDSKQVAVLVPTTILALQHFKSFSKRLEDFPVRVDYISRLRPAAEVRRVLKEVAAGQIDILIGTHRIVGKDVKFADLGLLVIDEEQKFGVSVKEKLKQFKVNVDTLTLTATPIPRTLQFSLMGARDLSIIQTPPPNRYPVVTELHGFNEDILRDAISYEISRGGQVFFIHNRVQNIYEVEATIKRLVPGVRTVVGHGQMDGPSLERVMLDFINGEQDVLIATTIIESGLDIPNANTIIVNHAENFGLSELHQLRGRVGRSNRKAFCYLIAPPLSLVNDDARKRLQAIEEFSELGSGFNISMRDLDIRGAGDLLGAEQSGFIADIGYDTYHRILNEAIQELKQTEYKGLFEEEEDANQAFLQQNFIGDCQIDTDMELLFPDAYIHSISERMLLYRELDSMDSEANLQSFEAALLDRFGKLPEPTKELLEVVRLRWLAINLGMERIVLKNHKMICYFVGDQQSPFYESPVFTGILTYVQHHASSCKLKENKGKLSLVFDKVNTMAKAKSIVEGISQ
ncbi:MAG: transcription-repair coupling factor [Mangrovibacterium sp.]